MVVLPPSRVLVVRLSSLGDILLTTPVLESLKAVWPECRVSVLVKEKYADVFAGHPAVDEVLRFESKGLFGWLAAFRRDPHDLYIDLHDTWRSRFWGAFGSFSNRVRYDKRAWERRVLVWRKKTSPRLRSRVSDRYLECLEELGIEPAVRRARLAPSGRLSSEWESRLGPGRFLGAAPGATHATKRWPAERFAEAADRLRAEMESSAPGKGPVKILLFGSAADEEAAREVLRHLEGPVLSLVGQTSIGELVLLVERCALLLTNDSGLMHIADALGVPLAAVFGPTVEPFGFFPSSSGAEVVEVKGLPCRPCSLHGTDKCPLGHFRCMRDIGPDRVIEAARRALARAG